VIESGDTANATDSADALVVLNNMMAEWKYSGKNLDYFPQDTLSDTIPIPDWAESAVRANLAIRCATTFRGSITQSLNKEAVDGENLVTRTLLNLNLEQADLRHLPQGDGRFGHNILTDT
jgi:hypothetical protein